MTNEAPETEIAKELRELSDAASFTTMDMAVWCECDRSALRNWEKENVIPHPIKQKHLKARLNLLRNALKRFPEMLPIPIQVKQYDRVAYVTKVRDYALKKLPKLDSAERRV